MRKNKLLLLLALLMTAATGAWAAEVTVTKTVNDLFPDVANGTQKATLYSDANLSISVNPDGNNGKVYATGEEWRLYQTNSAVVTVVATEATIKSVAFEFTVKNTGVIKYDGNAMTSGTAVNVNAASAQFVVGNFYEATNGQVIISGFTVVYETTGGASGYTVSLNDGTENPTTWTASTDGTNFGALPIGGLKGDGSETVTLKYNGRLKVKSVTATSDAAPAEEPVTLATPLTMEAITPGTIVVDIDGGTLETGMKYSVNGGTKTTITSTTSIEGLKAGDKVQFYGNGTQTQVYGDTPEVEILGDGDGFKTKVYGNIMSLLDETGFATKTDLPDARFVFYGLFKNNATLIDASELLLPAATLQESCYQAMFDDCTSLTKAPKLLATTLTTWCYVNMFKGCSKLATVTCLATSGIDQHNSTSNWLQGAGTEVQGTKTFNAVSTAEWPSGVNGIPSSWTRVNIDN